MKTKKRTTMIDAVAASLHRIIFLSFVTLISTTSCCWALTTTTVPTWRRERALSIHKYCYAPPSPTTMTSLKMKTNSQLHQSQSSDDDSSTTVDLYDEDEADTTTNNKNNQWLHHGLLISSFSDGLEKNDDAKNFLMHGIVSALSKERQQMAEEEVAESAVFSPCCGPDIDALARLEVADSRTDDLLTNEKSWEDTLQSLIETSTTARKETDGNDEDPLLEVRILFIPTAMYALRPDSTNTPGKQRQRERADGKKKRNSIVNILKEQLRLDNKNIQEEVSVLAITGDLDDNSAKQPEGSSDPTRFPSTAREALTEWKPHLIYIQGGNTFWLWHCIEKGNWQRDLIDAVTATGENRNNNPAIFCGASAGAIISGEYIETACWKGWDDPRVVPGKETYEDWEGLKGLGLVGQTSFFPHMTNGWQTTVDGKKEVFHVGSDVICIEDEEVYCVDGNTQSINSIKCSTRQLQLQ